MAEIKSLDLVIQGPKLPPGVDANAVMIKYEIHFFPIEVDLNVPFWEVAALIEQDDQLDEWHHYGRHHGLWWVPKEDRDDLVAWIHYGTVVPNGQSVVSRSWYKNIENVKWVRGGPDKGYNEFRPLVYVNPQITSHLSIGEVRKATYFDWT